MVSLPPSRERLLRGAVLVGAALLYLLGLDRSGWGNPYYAAAAQAGGQSWAALFFGSSDAGNSITVDKPPASLWVLGLSVRLFGLSSWSLLVPQALMAVAAVALLMAAIRRAAGPGPALLAGLLMAATPVVTLMARVDDPDMLLTLLVVAAAWSTVRALEDGRLRWALLTGALLGLGFLTKSLAAFLVLPGLAGAYLYAGQGRLRRRIGHLLAAGGALLVAAGWWVLTVELIPRSARPWVGGTRSDSPLELAFGYNGLGRLTGDENGGGVVAHRTGSPLRLFGSGGDEVGWLLPAAAIGLVAGLVLVRGRPRTDPVRAALLMWAGWAAGTGVVLSVMQGIWHAYYTVELAPAVAALVALGATLLRRRGTRGSCVVLAVGSLLTTAWAVSLIARRLVPAAALAGPVALFGLTGVLLLAAAGQVNRSVARIGVGLLLIAAVLGPLGWSVVTAALPHTGGAVSAGPVDAARAARAEARARPPVPAPLRVLLRTDTDDWTWTAATVGRRAADLQLASRAPVMPIGGYFGRDPSPTLPEFRALVRAHRVHWYVPGLHGRGPAVQIDTWARRHAPAVRLGATTVYDLSRLARGHAEDPG